LAHAVLPVNWFHFKTRVFVYTNERTNKQKKNVIAQSPYAMWGVASQIAYKTIRKIHACICNFAWRLAALFCSSVYFNGTHRTSVKFRKSTDWGALRKQFRNFYRQYVTIPLIHGFLCYGTGSVILRTISKLFVRVFTEIFNSVSGHISPCLNYTIYY